MTTILYESPARLSAVLKQREIPVIFRRPKARLYIWLPYAKDNRFFLKGDKKLQPEWIRDKGYWETPHTWFNELVDRLLQKFGKLYIIQPLREQEKCAPACLNAQGHICQCSCLGANHGAGNDGSWFEVSETFAVRWKEVSYACRLMVANQSLKPA